MASAMMEFERNVQAYQRELPRLLQQGLEGRFVLIGSGEVRGVFLTSGEARKEGHRRYGLNAFLTKEVLRSDLAVEQSIGTCRA